VDKQSKTRGVPINLCEEDGALFTALPNYAGMFSLSLKKKALCAKIRGAYAQQREISLTYDWEFKILDVE
jgi:hypothetical protein